MLNKQSNREPITIVNGRLTIPHLGISLRAALGAAINNRDKLIAGSAKHRFPVYYNNAKVAEISLGKDFR